MLVHGEKSGMDIFKNKIENDFKIKCYYPANGEIIQIFNSNIKIPLYISSKLLKRSICDYYLPFKKIKINGIFIEKKNQFPILFDSNEAFNELGLESHNLNFKFERNFYNLNFISLLKDQLKKYFNFKFEENLFSLNTLKIHILENKLSLIFNEFDEDIGIKILNIVYDCLNTFLLNN
jgi:hypothetical protein